MGLVSLKYYRHYFYDTLNALDCALSDSPELSDWINDTWHSLLDYTEDFHDKTNLDYLFKLYNDYWKDYYNKKLDNDIFVDKLEKHYPLLNK